MGLRCVLPVVISLSMVFGSLAQVVINEVGWAGTQASGYDEWIELYNPSGAEVDLSGWRLLLGDREVPLSGTVPPWGFYLLERTDDTTVPAIEADRVYKGALPNAGAVLVLLDPEGNVVDSANLGAPEGWFAGDVASAASMERISPEIADSPVAWRTGIAGDVHDADGNPIHGTPKGANAALARLVPVRFTLPASLLRGTVELHWEVEGDVEGLLVKIFVKAGERWELLAEDLPTAGTYLLDTTALPNGKALFALGVFDELGARGGVVVEGEIAN